MEACRSSGVSSQQDGYLSKAGLCAELVATLEALLQQHHDRLLERLQSAGVPGGPLQRPKAAKAGRADVQGLRSSLKGGRETTSVMKQGVSFSEVGDELEEVEGIVLQEETTENGDPDFSKCKKRMKSQRELAVVCSSRSDLSDDAKARGGEKSGRSAKTLEEDWAEASLQGEASLQMETAARTDCSTYSKYANFHRARTLHLAMNTDVLDRDSTRSEDEGYGLWGMGASSALAIHAGVADLVKSHAFEAVMSVVIMTNVIFCGTEVEYMAQHRLEDPPAAFRWISMCYLVLFSIELLIRLIAEGKLFIQRPSVGWNIFDSLLIAIALLEVHFDLDSRGGRQVSSVRIIRIARVARVLRIARIVRHFRSLRILIHSVLNTLRSLLWTMLLLSIILYVFGILFTTATTQHLLLADHRHIPLLEDAYGTLGKSVYTLFQSISGGVSWRETVDPLSELDAIWLAFYLGFFSFTYFAVLNVVTGVFCQQAIESANHDHEMAMQAQLAAKQHYVERLNKIFQEINVSHTQKITLLEFERGMQDEKLRAYFESIDLSTDQAFELFRLLDREDAHVLDIDAFVDGCLKLRGQAKSIDIAMMMCETRWCLQKCLSSIKDVETKLVATVEAQRWEPPADCDSLVFYESTDSTLVHGGAQPSDEDYSL